MIALRTDWSLLVDGNFELLVPNHESLFAYVRSDGDEQALVVLNFADEQTAADLSNAVATGEFEPVIDNFDDQSGSDLDVPLRPYEARVYERE